MSALVLALVALPAVAMAKGKRPSHGGGGGGGAKRIAITSADGGGAAEGPVRAQVTKILKKAKIKVIPQPKGGAPTDDQQWVALGQKLKVDGFVQLSFEGERGKQSVEISVRTGSDGSSLGSETFAAKGPPAKLGQVVAKGFWKKLGAQIKQTGAAKASESGGIPPRDLSHEETVPSKPETPAEPETPPVAEKTPEPTPEPAKPEEAEEKEEKPKPAPPRQREPEEETGARRAPSLYVSLQGQYLRRSYAYTPSDAGPGSTALSPSVGGEVAWFPLTNFGLDVGGQFQKWLKVIGHYPATLTEVHGSLVYRRLFSFGDLYVRAGGFRQSSSIADDGSGSRVNLSVPDVVYLGARAGAGVRVHLTRLLDLTVDANYRYVASLKGGTYPLTSDLYFPRAKAGPAFDGAIALAIRLTPMLDLQVGGDVRRYVITANGMPGDRVDASGITDLYLSGWLGVGGVFGRR